jgi:hypothetical protein
MGGGFDFGGGPGVWELFTEPMHGVGADAHAGGFEIGVQSFHGVHREEGAFGIAGGRGRGGVVLAFGGEGKEVVFGGFMDFPEGFAAMGCEALESAAAGEGAEFVAVEFGALAEVCEGGEGGLSAGLEELLGMGL